MPTSTSHSQIRPLPEFRPPRPPVSNFGASFFLQNPISNHEINWAFRPIPISIAAVAVPSSSSSSASYFPQPFQLYAGAEMAPPPGTAARVIQPPRRPHSGLWFMLQASQTQENEPFLPQISKSYLRIKDGRMTVRLVIKYLVNKLNLENESELIRNNA
ncbi:RING finger protein [Perilla frutescens var. hirtella]|uniref:RING finger protein n=1 Tax=Perilla frutescens var. hirtella TaxID=608512 RepID=A0AAD4JPW6_PERFH|nr:RING finger protein [Perilla frutescens var. hirtella]